MGKFIADRKPIDLISSVELAFNEMFVHVFQNDEAREYFGYSKISPFFSGEGFPGWYLWFKDIKGAFSIEITEENIICGADDPVAERNEDQMAVRFVLRYFPAVDEEMFRDFSPAEQNFRNSPAFDTTGTPTFDGRLAMNENFYFIGQMIVSLNQCTDRFDFYCRSSERAGCLEMNAFDSVEPYFKKSSSSPPDGLNLREDGWNKSRYVFDKIISAYIFLIGYPPSFIEAWARPAADHLYSKPERKKNLKNVRLIEFLLLVSFDKGFCEFSRVEKIHSPRSKYFVGRWDNKFSIPAQWHNNLWWSITERHFHGAHGHLCGCFNE